MVSTFACIASASLRAVNPDKRLAIGVTNEIPCGSADARGELVFDQARDGLEGSQSRIS
jgi:hypothetical protein